MSKEMQAVEGPKNIKKKREKTDPPPKSSQAKKKRKLGRKSKESKTPESNTSDASRHKKRRRASSNNSPLQVFRSTFLTWDISGVTKTATSPDGSLIVVARKSNSIELRRKAVGWTTTFVLRWDIHDDTATVSAMTFDTSGKYLLVGRFNGIIDIYSVSVEGLCPFVVLEPGGGAVMSLAIRPSSTFEVAVGCEDGRVRFVSIDEQFKDLSLLHGANQALPTDPSLYAVRRGHKSPGMCLSLCWKPFENIPEGMVVCGDSEGRVRWISGSSKKLMGAGTLPLNDGRASHVWTIEVVAKGHHVVCGDSRGFYSIWSSTTFTKIEENRFEGMAGDLWTSVATSPVKDGSESILFGCAGGSVASLKSLVSSDGSVSWSPSRGRSVHLNDVRSMSKLGKRGFITGSTDTRICVFEKSFNAKTSLDGMLLHYHEAAGQHPNQFLPKHRLIISRQKERIDFWQLPKSVGPDPVLALRLKYPSRRGNLRSCAISSDASRLAVSACGHFCLYKAAVRTSDDESKVALLGTVSPVVLPKASSKLLESSDHLLFLGSTLVSISEDRQELVLLITESKAIIVTKTQLGSTAMFLTQVAVCEKTKSIAVADSAGDVFCCSLPDGVDTNELMLSFKKIASFGKDKAVGCFTYSKKGTTLAASLLDNSLAILSISERKVRLGVTKPFPSLATCVSFSSDEKSVLLSGHDFCYIAKWSVRKTKAMEGTTLKLKRVVHPLSIEKSLIGSCVMGPSSVFLAQRPWEAEQEFLPRVVPKKMYGI